MIFLSHDDKRIALQIIKLVIFQNWEMCARQDSNQGSSAGAANTLRTELSQKHQVETEFIQKINQYDISFDRHPKKFCNYAKSFLRKLAFLNFFYVAATIIKKKY